MVFWRFIKQQLTDTVQYSFYDIIRYLIKADTIDIVKIFIDGAKIETYARKTSFAWKKAVRKCQETALNHLNACQKKWSDNYPHAFKPWIDNWN